MKDDQNCKKTNPEVTIEFLDSLLQKNSDFARHMDNQTNILVALSLGIFIVSISQIKNIDGLMSLPLLILAIFSLLAAIVALFAVIPPWFMRKRGQEQSLLYSKKIGDFSSSSEYAEELARLLSDPEKIIQQYAIEIYNLCRYYYRPKRQLFKISRHLLLIGVSAALIAMIIVLI